MDDDASNLHRHRVTRQRAPRNRHRSGPVIRRRRAHVLLVIDRLGRAVSWCVEAEDLVQQLELEGPAQAAFDALRAALEAAA